MDIGLDDRYIDLVGMVMSYDWNRYGVWKEVWWRNGWK